MIIKNAGFLQEDYDKLDKDVNAKKVIRLADVQDRIERVAFDVVRFRDSEGLDKLWVIQEKDGEKVLVAMYDDEQEIESKASWTTLSDRVGNINVFYKGEPIKRFAMSYLGLENEDASSVCRYLPAKLAEDKELVSALLNELSDTERATLFEKYPELKG